MKEQSRLATERLRQRAELEQAARSEFEEAQLALEQATAAHSTAAQRVAAARKEEELELAEGHAEISHARRAQLELADGETALHGVGETALTAVEVAVSKCSAADRAVVAALQRRSLCDAAATKAEGDAQVVPPLPRPPPLLHAAFRAAAARGGRSRRARSQ